MFGYAIMSYVNICEENTSHEIVNIDVDVVPSATLFRCLTHSQIAVVEDNLMYWGDAGYQRIERANLDGTQRTLLSTSTTAHYYAMALDSTFIYFTDSWTER